MQRLHIADAIHKVGSDDSWAVTAKAISTLINCGLLGAMQKEEGFEELHHQVLLHIKELRETDQSL
jgi:hypothetical protein